MSLDLWLAFVAASTALLLITGLTRAGGITLMAMGLATAALRRPI